MLIAFANLAPITLALLLGLQLGRRLHGPFDRWVARAANTCLYLLLLLMGVTIGQLPDFLDQLARVGGTAMLMAGATSAAVVVLGIALIRQPTQAPATPELENHPSGWQHLREPLELLALVGAGFLLARTAWLPALPYEAAVSALLYGLITCIGFKLAAAGIRLNMVLRNRRAATLGALTVLSSYLGASLCGPLLGLSLREAWTVASGFGWYSLSGLLITELGNPVLGSVAFLTDLLREALALTCLPLLARRGHLIPAIGLCGATAMDVTLPVIERYATPQESACAFALGALLSFLGPLLIPLCYTLPLP